ncbi:MAG: hypothetical protein J6S51_00845 [Kiritimatiellae bacterium]|nr:hypothetical protein [Kiritimatiellia bacterium]
MADGTYERRGPREMELARLRRIIKEIRQSSIKKDTHSPVKNEDTSQK